MSFFASYAVRDSMSRTISPAGRSSAPSVASTALSPKGSTGFGSTVSIAASIFASPRGTQANKPNARSARTPLSSLRSSRRRSRPPPVPGRSRWSVRCATRFYIPRKHQRAKRSPAPNATATSKPNEPKRHEACSIRQAQGMP